MKQFRVTVRVSNYHVIDIEVPDDSILPRISEIAQKTAREHYVTADEILVTDWKEIKDVPSLINSA